MPRPPRFTIRAASALTGVNPNTLRAWERRYGLVVPERTPKGYRLYTEDDVQRLRLIQRALQRGISVGRVMDHLEDSESLKVLLDDLEREPQTARPPRTVEVSLAACGLSGTTTIQLPARGGRGPGDHSLDEFADQLEKAAIRFDRVALERSFSRATGLYSLRDSFYRALAPALTRVGERYLKNLGSVAEEHFLTAFAREKLLAALAGLRPLHQQPRVLCACVPGEQHELGLMLLALEFGLEGVSTLYLGANVPAEALLHATTGSNLRAAVLSATMAVPLDAMVEARARLQERSRRLRVFVGGPAAQKQRALLESRGFDVLPVDPPAAARYVMERIGRA